MLASLFAAFNTPAPRALPPEEINWTIMICCLVAAVLLLALVFLFRPRFLKIICGCASEICLFLACKEYFGSNALITQIACWVTAVIVCIVTVTIVNSIDWNKLRSHS